MEEKIVEINKPKRGRPPKNTQQAPPEVAVVEKPEYTQEQILQVWSSELMAFAARFQQQFGCIIYYEITIPKLYTTLAESVKAKTDDVPELHWKVQKLKQEESNEIV